MFLLSALPAAASTEAARKAARHHRSVAWRASDLGAWPRQRLPRGHGPYHEAYWWHRAYQWHRAARSASSRLDALRHPSATACYQFIDRRFGATGMAGVVHAIAARESGCHWYAQNPYSSAAGPLQFLDTWGPLSLRLDVVWSVNRAYRYWNEKHSLSPWYPVPYS